MSAANQSDQFRVPVGILGRADLLQALVMANQDEIREMALAAVLGFIPLPKIDSVDDKKTKTQAQTDAKFKDENREQPQVQEIFRPYQLVTVDNVVSSEEWQSAAMDAATSGTLNESDLGVWDDTTAKPEVIPIVPWTRLWPKLRAAVAKSHASTLDIPRLTQQLSQGIAIQRIPRKKRLSWPDQLPVVLDFSDRLTPYWEDWHWLKNRILYRFNQTVSLLWSCKACRKNNCSHCLMAVHREN